MNSANIRGKSIEDGDYIIVDKIDGYTPQDNDIVISNIGGLANVKRFKRELDRIVLLSESHRQRDFSPIFIDEQDDYTIEGKVVDIIKGIRS
jgi:SOS-response transcriptional repressor LexA